MNVEDAVNKLVLLEKNESIRNMVFEGHNVWPLVRVATWFALVSPLQRKHRVVLSVVKFLLVTFFSFFTLMVKRKKLTKHAEIVLMTEDVSYTEVLNFKRYNRLFDPLFELFSKDHSVIKIDQQRNQDNYFKSENINLSRNFPWMNIKIIIFIVRNINCFKIMSNIVEIPVLNLIVYVMTYLMQASSAERIFNEDISGANPSLIMFDGYYSATSMGLIAATKKRNITTVDVQHGKQGCFQGAYTHWTDIPKEGYDYLPDFFWVWGRESEINIMSSSPARLKHKCVIGGYQWLDTFKSKPQFNAIPKWLLEKIDTKCVILVSLQAKRGGLKEVIPEELSSAIIQSPDDWIWLLRRHPYHMYVKTDVISALSDVSDDKYVIDNLNDVPLYAILKIAKHHITAYSTVLYEAEAFGVQNSLFGSDAISLYGNEIKQGRFHYFESASQLLDNIHTSINDRDNTWCGEKYIETGEELVRNAFDKIMSK